MSEHDEHEYEGPDRRREDRFDWLRLLPLVLAVCGGIYGYASLNAVSETTRRTLQDHLMLEAHPHAATWEATTRAEIGQIRRDLERLERRK